MVYEEFWLHPFIPHNFMYDHFSYNRTSIALGVDDVYYWAYLNGGRLPIGATRLPQNVDLKYVKLEFKEA